MARGPSAGAHQTRHQPHHDAQEEQQQGAAAARQLLQQRHFQLVVIDAQVDQQAARRTRSGCAGPGRSPAAARPARSPRRGWAEPAPGSAGPAARPTAGGRQHAARQARTAPRRAGSRAPATTSTAERGLTAHMAGSCWAEMPPATPCTAPTAGRPRPAAQRAGARTGIATAQTEGHRRTPGAGHSDGQPQEGGARGIEAPQGVEQVLVHQRGRQAAPDQPAAARSAGR